MTKIPHIRRRIEKASWLSKRGDTFVNGAVCAGNPEGVSCTIIITIFRTFFEVLKNDCSVSKKTFRHAESLGCQIQLRDF